MHGADNNSRPAPLDREALARSASHSAGVGRRLLLAFVGISGFAVLAAAAAIYAFLTNQEAFDRVTEEKMPAAIAALELSRQSERIVAAAPALLTVQAPQQHEQLSVDINSEVTRLQQLVDDLQAYERNQGIQVDATGNRRLLGLVEEIHTNLGALDTLVEQRLNITRQKKRLVQALINTHAETDRLLEPWLQTTEAGISGYQAELAASTDPGNSTAATGVELATAISTFRVLQQVQATTASINDQLLQLGSVESQDRLQVAEFRLNRSLRDARQLSQQLHPKLQALLNARINEYSALAQGDGSLTTNRKMELELLAPAERLLGKNAELSRVLTRSVDTLVSASQEQINQARAHARLVETVSISVLLTVVGLSLISSALIVWRYVRRNLVNRLTRLSNHMLAIAAGNLDVHIDDQGDDEIADMARALKVFRDTAVEVRETNLRELREARRRLADAIDSISEGFALFDSEDRLILHNQRFVDMFPGLEEIVVQGAGFEEIVRSDAYRALLTQAPEQEEETIAERIRRHRKPEAPFLQRYRNGRWIRISERETSSEGTVAVYADVTDVKRTEEIADEARLEAETALMELKKAQNSLVQAEKLAQLGQLVAGIAHELKNPLNFVKNFAEVSQELLEELSQTLRDTGAKQADEDTSAEIAELLDTLNSNLGRIQEHGMRADGIIKSMLAHSRGGSRDWQRVNINRLVEESINLAYHGARATDAGFDLALESDLDENIVEIEVIPQDISRVLLNLLSNSFDAVRKRATEAGDPSYRPQVSVSTAGRSNSIEIVVRDNGSGMSPEIRDKVFTPFFTTKPAGQGTGLGLSLSYDIIHHEHGGQIEIRSENNAGTEMIVRLPRQPQNRRVTEPEAPASEVMETES